MKSLSPTQIFLQKRCFAPETRLSLGHPRNVLNGFTPVPHAKSLLRLNWKLRSCLPGRKTLLNYSHSTRQPSLCLRRDWTGRFFYSLQLVEVADQHDIGVVFVQLGIEHVAAVGRDGDAVGEFAISFEDFPSVPGCEVVEANGPWRGLRNEINSARHDRPLVFKRDVRYSRNGLRRCVCPIQRQNHRQCVRVA